MSRNRRRLSAVFVTLALVGGACGGGDDAFSAAPDDPACEETTEVRVGASRLDGLVRLAMADGLFASHCLRLSVDDTLSSTAVTDALVAGTIDFGLTDALSAGAVVANHSAPIQIIGVREVTAGPDQDVVAFLAGADSGIAGPEDLEGTTIGIRSEGVLCTIVMKQAMVDAGIDDPAAGATFQEFETDDALKAGLSSGEVDAICLPHPSALGPMSDGALVVGGAATTYPEGMVAGVTAVSDEFAAASPDLVVAWNKAMSEAAPVIAADEAAFRDRLPELTGVSKETAQAGVLPKLVGGADPADFDFESLWDSATTFGRIVQPVETSAVFG